MLASLRRLDPCSLLDPAAVGAPAGVAPQPTTTDGCRIDIAELGDHVSVMLGEKFDRGERYRSALLDLNGMKAYLDVSEPGTDSCQVVVPVSFRRVVSFVGRAGPRSAPGDLCATTRAAAEAAVPRLIGLGYESDEPDQPLAGACVDYPFETECRPGAEADVPDDPQDVLPAAAADPGVACTLAGQALRTRVDANLVPVISGPAGEQAQCSFVEPDHTVLVDIVVAPNDSLDSDGEQRQVAGRQAKSTTSTGDRSSHHRLCTLPVAGSTSGQLCLALTILAGRGVENDVPPDSTKQSVLEPALADITRAYFS
ncbi:hypothetical protein GCM10027436_51560 [Actinophytocola sediminis]